MLAFVVLGDQTCLKRPSILSESSVILWIGELFYVVQRSCDLFDAMILVASWLRGEFACCCVNVAVFIIEMTQKRKV